MTFTFWPVERSARAVAPALLGLLAIAAILCAAPVRADDLQDASQLLKQGQHAQALDRINQYFASRPRDAQGRFLKGLIFAEQNKNPEAIDIFTKLTQDYPELPEPYNNLAVLYAAQGQYEKARQSLELSIRTHPSYAMAYENLGDVYTKLASQTYDKALQLDSSNSAAKTKLLLVRDMITGNAGNTRPAKPGAPRPEAARPTVLAAALRAAEPKPAPSPEATVATAPVDAKVAAKPKPQPEPRPVAESNDETVKTVHAWAQAWAARDVKTYLSFYSRDFKTSGGKSRAEWEKGRALRITGPKQIEVGIDAARVTPSGGQHRQREFFQTYRSDRLKVISTKTLVLIRNNGKWLIQQERAGS